MKNRVARERLERAVRIAVQAFAARQLHPNGDNAAIVVWLASNCGYLGESVLDEIEEHWTIIQREKPQRTL